MNLLLLLSYTATFSTLLHAWPLQQDAGSDCSGEHCRPQPQDMGHFDEVSLLQKSAVREKLQTNAGSATATSAAFNTALNAARDQWKGLSPIHGCKAFDCIQQYVDLHDPSYSWKDTGLRIHGTGSSYGDEADSSASLVGWTAHILNMTSQTWLAEHVKFPVWWHNLVVVVPENRKVEDWATLQLDFGVNDRKTGQLTRIENRGAEDGNDATGKATITIDEHNLDENVASLRAVAEKTAYLAVKTGAIAASLLNVPNGYDVFKDDPTQLWRATDTLRGYTYTDFLLHPDHPEILHELPVAKAVVRALDTITDFSATLPTPSATSRVPGRGSDKVSLVQRFAVSGYSKHGHATLVAGALDPRVEVIVPASVPLWMVPAADENPDDQVGLIDMSHFTEVSMQATGKRWRDVYLAEALSGVRGDPGALEMHRIIDPSAWMSKLTKPTLYQAGSSDEYLGRGMYDDLKEKLPQLPGITRVNFVPNGKHEDALWEGLPSTAAFISGHFQNKDIPRISEAFSPAALSFEVRQVSDHKPIQVQQWLTSDEDHKCVGAAKLQFTVGDVQACPFWRGSDLQETSPGSGIWLASPEPALKTIGMFVTATYEWPEPGSKFTISSFIQNTTSQSIWQDKTIEDLKGMNI